MKKYLRIKAPVLSFSIFIIIGFTSISFSQSNEVITEISGIGKITTTMIDNVKSIEPLLNNESNFIEIDTNEVSLKLRIQELKIQILVMEFDGKPTLTMREDLWRLERLAIKLETK